MPSFTGGFKALAEQLGADIVGWPLEDEVPITADHTFQTTTKGLMWYRNGGAPLFLPHSRTASGPPTSGDMGAIVRAIDELTASLANLRERLVEPDPQ